MNDKNKSWFWPAISIALFAILITLILGPWPMIWSHNSMDISDMTRHSNMEAMAHDIQEKQDYIIKSNRDEGKYSCCLEKPCVYCINKSSAKHGEGTSCQCLNDIMNGRHPCGECIGEILEGHGNKYLSKYFASSIAEEVGVKYLPTLKEIISDKYDVSVEEQL
jgi:hypothetical protein